MGGVGMAGPESPHAALLIDFDNVTMGMRSDLSKELKTLLDSDVIKGKVSVQRAYADWRRYPQYIVPLSEASVDLIFAPAYGSNKKNATDLRMAIDALELVFIRPEIGTYILLTGDSDFSSLVLKLKEYGKYVIGVGLQESSSDILVQNCDEYYSYTSLTGLTNTAELDHAARDPWTLVRDAVTKMVSRGDVMRSDRLKQVMQELDPSFDESSIGFSKFSKFLAEAASRGLVGLKKMENGQYEITATKARNSRRESGRPRSRRGGARGSRQDLSSTRAEVATGAGVEGKEGLAQAYEALRSVLSDLHAVGKDPVRDSDLKRKMLAADSDFDETELGFAKFSRFLGQAEKDGVVSVSRTERGNLDVSMIKDPKPLGGGEDFKEDGTGASSDDAKGEVVDDLSEAQKPQKRGWFGLRFGSRRGSKNDSDEAPKLFEGQGVKATMGSEHISSDPSTELLASQESLKVERSVSRGYNTEEVLREVPAESDMADTEDVKVSDLALPSDPGAIARYLTHRYKGVGEKTADTLVKELGSELFRTMHENPDYIAGIIPKNRAEQVLEAWRADYERRARGHRGWSRAKNRES
tara:strand:+ start:8342 stop:10090 length:1749 start_codon:yes stop_codon:yes gene_type:complete